MNSFSYRMPSSVIVKKWVWVLILWVASWVAVFFPCLLEGKPFFSGEIGGELYVGDFVSRNRTFNKIIDITPREFFWPDNVSQGSNLFSERSTEGSSGLIFLLKTNKVERYFNSSLGISSGDDIRKPASKPSPNDSSDDCRDEMCHWSFLQWVVNITLWVAVSIPASLIGFAPIWFFCWRPYLKSDPLDCLTHNNLIYAHPYYHRIIIIQSVFEIGNNQNMIITT
jgi:hypothetical protein